MSFRTKRKIPQRTMQNLCFSLRASDLTVHAVQDDKGDTPQQISLKSVPLGMYCLISPFVFSLATRTQE